MTDRAPEPESDGHTLVDGHVHLHGCFDLEPFFDAAVRNFRRGAERLGLGAPWTGCLVLCDTATQNSLRDLRDLDEEGVGSWTFHATGEASSLLARRGDGEALHLIAGRQIATEEGLELLVVGEHVPIPDGIAFSEGLDRTLGGDAIVVIPWGFGKWWFRRGRLVRRALEDRASGQLFLGDNGGRPGLGPEPRLFETGRVHGIPVLPGSDPLPFRSQVERPGRYGFVLPGVLDGTPSAEIRTRLRSLSDQPAVFGRLESLSSFLRFQVAMQVAKRTGR